MEDVAGHQFPGFHSVPLSIAFHLGLQGQGGLESSDGIACLRLFPETNHSVREKQQQDDGKVRPMPIVRGKDHGNFNHPRNRTPEISQKRKNLIRLLVSNLIGANLCQPAKSFGLMETIR